MKKGITGAINSLVKTLESEAGKFFVYFNEVDHVIEMEFLFKDKALALSLLVVLQTEVEKLQENE